MESKNASPTGTPNPNVFKKQQKHVKENKLNAIAIAKEELTIRSCQSTSKGVIIDGSMGIEGSLSLFSKVVTTSMFNLSNLSTYTTIISKANPERNRKAIELILIMAKLIIYIYIY